MEFHEKLQELRKSRGMTQEELAEALYVSRTAISKWESGRGYPSIDSLKEISRYFSVTIDALLSGETLLSIAEQENKSNLQRMGNLLFGMVDICAFLLIVLPLYPNTTNGHVYSVNLATYTGIALWNYSVHWVLFLSLMASGISKVVLTQYAPEKKDRWITDSSMVVHIVAVFFLALTREAYAITVAFLLLVIKGLLLFKSSRTDKKKR